MTKPRRKKHFIDSCVQGALARRIIGHWLLFLTVAAAVSFILQVLSNPFRPLAEHVQNLWWTHGPFLLVLVFLLPVFIIDTIKLSNRFAGPVYSLRRAMRELVQGKTPRKLKFRKHDFWHDLADDYNAMLLRLDLLEEEKELIAEHEQLATAKD
jgi:hypothetical protein